MLSTPDTHIFEAASSDGASNDLRLSDEDFGVSYEIERTLAEIKKGRYARVALQFPDSMLPVAPRIFEALSKGLDPLSEARTKKSNGAVDSHHTSQELVDRDIVSDESHTLPIVRLYILADTSYGACCVDEIAAEHVNAEAVVHYGRACLSPTARIPVIHIFTRQSVWNQDELSRDIEGCFKNKEEKFILMADVTFQYHLRAFRADFRDSTCYKDLHVAEVIYDPSSPIPNRTVPKEVIKNPATLRGWHLLHISDPPESLLLTLASRVASIRIFAPAATEHGKSHESFLASTSRALNRRYALLTSVATVSIFGILINTLSVKNYLHIVEYVKAQISAAGKKSYTFVVGKVNAAKVANFSEIGAWVVIGCWESSLIDSKDFWKPVLTPFELELALKSDGERLWTGEWSSDFQKILDEPKHTKGDATTTNGDGVRSELHEGNNDYEPESAPPEFDLRTGRYVSHSRPMRSSGGPVNEQVSGRQITASGSLIRRVKGDLAVVGGELSPGAEHLKSKRTWKGLGSDFEIAYEEAGAAVEQGRSGIARGYTHGKDDAKT